MGQGEKLSSRLHSVRNRNSDVKSWEAAYGEILILKWGGLLNGEMLMLVLGRLHDRQAV